MKETIANIQRDIRVTKATDSPEINGGFTSKKYYMTRYGLLKKCCSDCKYKHLTLLHDPCYNCVEDKFVNNVPKYYENSKQDC